MTQEEADKIAAIFETADGECWTCVDNICKEANRAGLGFFFAIVGEDDYSPKVVATPACVRRVG